MWLTNIESAADAGYDSHENLTWLKNNHYLSCIKPQYYEKAKTRAWTNDISKSRNMEYIPEEDAFICAKGRKLKYAFTHNAKAKTGFISERKVYICESCNRCGYKKEWQRYVKPTIVNPVKRIETTPAYELYWQKTKIDYLVIQAFNYELTAPFKLKAHLVC